MKRSVTLALLLVFLIAQRYVFANSEDAIDGYTSAQYVECHEDMEADHVASAHRDIQCLECPIQAVSFETDAPRGNCHFQGDTLGLEKRDRTRIRVVTN